MNKFNFKFVLLLVFVLFSATSIFAWDSVGHQLTSYVAWERMSPDVREKVVKILLDAPEDSDLSVHYDAFNSRSSAVKKRELFMYASYWSDVIRNRKFKVRHKKYNQGNWHYADIFWKQENGKAIIIKDFPEESGKAIYKLSDFEKILSDPSYKNEEKAIALAWFLHVGGDIHNPVHNASRVTKNSPKGDQGGNRFVLQKRTKTKRRINLHGYWDSIIGNVTPRQNDECDTDYLSPIAQKLIKKYPFSKMQNRLKLSDYNAWNMEGFAMLNSYVYNGVTRNQMPSKKYRKRTYNLASEQITLAGYRLGETLNRIFSNNNKPAKPKIMDKSKSNLNEQDAIAIWKKVKSIIDNNKTFKFLKVDITDSTVTLSGLISSATQKTLAVEEIKKVAGVKEVVDLIVVDQSIAPKTANNNLSMSKNPPECKIIRKVLYPVSKRRSPKQKLKIALLDLCPPNKGLVSRPMTSLLVNGDFVMFEYDVAKVFENEVEAKKYAKKNNITNVNY